ncbi:MAG: reverse transcriptase domain-containing protein [Cyanobacteria bacterium J06582_2]
MYSYLDKETSHGDHKQSFKKSLQDIAYKSFYNFKPHKVFSPIFTKSDISVLRNLAKDPNIVICKPDKGHGVVILDKADYIGKMEHILNDRSKFRELLSEDPLLHTLNMENKVNFRIRKLKKDGLLSEELASSLMASGTQPGIMYGTPKIHKTGLPLRPILSAINTCSYNLSKYLVNKLSPLTFNEYTIKNSYEFVDLINSVEAATNYVMCSFDIESLFTNIPLKETIDIILQQLFPNPEDIFEGFNRKQFKILLELATSTSTFLFNDRLYEQIDGVAMGSPCGPTLANIFLCFCEKKWLSDCPAEFKPFLYRRYVDDTFLLFRNSNHINKFLEYLNSKHSNIKFTKEEEQDNTLPFLDVLVTRKHNNFQTSVFFLKTEV